MELVEQLMQYGLTRQEAVIYLTLHSDGELTGYEVAKLTGISRSNVYTALAGLVEKGVAYVQEEGVTKYSPVSFEEFSSNYIHHLKETRARVIKSLPARKKESEGYITIRGKRNILDKIRNMLNETCYRVYMAAGTEVLELYRSELENLTAKGIKVVLLTEQPFILDGAVIYCKPEIDGQIRLICDSHKVLTGQAAGSGDAACLYSQNQNLVDVFKEMLHNEIKLIELVRQKP